MLTAWRSGFGGEIVLDQVSEHSSVLPRRLALRYIKTLRVTQSSP
jgi:hypothetical protein